MYKSEDLEFDLGDDPDDQRIVVPLGFNKKIP